MKAQTIFERNEKKFLFPKKRLAQFLGRASPYIEQDIYGKYTICSLYFDSPNFECACRQLAKPVYREKLRLRSYGVPKKEDTVYLELKKKLDGITYKRRTPLTLQEAGAYLLHDIPPAQNGQVFGEIDWFRRQKKLESKIIICYDRLAFTGKENVGLRITIDENVRWRDTSLDLSKGDWGHPLTEAGTLLMEIKTPQAIPLWLCRILSQEGIHVQSFSKYGNTFTHALEEEGSQIAG